MKTLFLLLSLSTTIIPHTHRTGALQCVSSLHLLPDHQKIPSSNYHLDSFSLANTTHQSKPSYYIPHTYRTGALQCASCPNPIITPLNNESINPSNHQPDTLPPISQLHHSIDSFYAQQTHLQLLEFKDSKKGEWLKFLPNLGITYTIDGQPRPSLSISSGILYQSKKTKQQNAAKRQRIIQQQLQASEQTKSQLTDLILQYQQLQNEYRTQQELFAIETDLFLIKKDEYERQEIAPSDFLQAKRTYLLQQQAVEQKEHQLGRLISKIKIHCHY